MTEMDPAEPSMPYSPAIQLPRLLGSAAAPGIKETLSSYRGSSVVLDASEVDLLGVQCVQVLMAARRQWLSDGVEFEIRNPSACFGGDLELLGLSPQAVGLGRSDL